MSDAPIVRIPAVDAYKHASRNGLRRYPSPERDGDRLYPLADPASTPSFRMGADDTVFTIGSCFARNVEAALEKAGINVLSRNFDLGPIGESLGYAGNFFNKYSIHSINNELRWALERETFPGSEILYPLQGGDKKYCDLQLGSAKLEFPAQDILEFRQRYLDVMAKAVEADVVIVTLGYVETWYDRELDIYLNVAPPAPLCKKEPERFEFRVLSYQDVLDGLRETYAILKKYRTKPLKMLVTVSPVPLLSTFRDMDVLVANSYSKSVQRAAIDAFLLETEGVDYFPSYEFVVLSNPSIAWSRGDYRHVNPDVVARIMSNVILRYLPEELHSSDLVSGANGQAMTVEALESSARMMLKLEEYEPLMELLEAHDEVVQTHAPLMQIKALGLRRMDQVEDAFDVMTVVSELAPNAPLPLERRITWCRALDRPQVARELLALHAKKFPRRDKFRNNITWLD